MSSIRTKDSKPFNVPNMGGASFISYGYLVTFDLKKIIHCTGLF